MARGRSTNGMSRLSPDRAMRWKRPRRSMTMTSAWPMILIELVATNRTESRTSTRRTAANMAAAPEGKSWDSTAEAREEERGATEVRRGAVGARRAPSALAPPSCASVLPVGHEDVGLVRAPRVPVGGPHELPAVGAEHREAV